MQDEKVIALIRQMRHDFGNCLQIISANIELERTEKCKEIIDKWIIDSASERKLFALKDAGLVLHLYQSIMDAHNLGIVLRIDEVDIVSSQKLIAKNEPTKAIKLLFFEEWKEIDDLTLHLRISERNEVISLHISWENGDSNYIEYIIEE